MSQAARVLKHLQSGKTTTALEAMNRWGIMRLAARIGELRDLGYPILSVMKKGQNRFGEEVKVAEYRL